MNGFFCWILNFLQKIISKKFGPALALYLIYISIYLERGREEIMLIENRFIDIYKYERLFFVEFEFLAKNYIYKFCHCSLCT